MFILLHLTSSGDELYVGVSHIAAVWKNPIGTTVYMIGENEDYFAVKESVKEVTDLIHAALHPPEAKAKPIWDGIPACPGLRRPEALPLYGGEWVELTGECRAVNVGELFLSSDGHDIIRRLYENPREVRYIVRLKTTD